MIRFSTSLENTKRVSRAELSIDNDPGIFSSQDIDSEVAGDLEHLNRLLKRLLPEPTQEAEPKRKKRRMIEIDEVVDAIPDEPILFRLVSRTLPPIQLSLKPPPPPPPITIEPDCEDREAQARLRRQQAESTSVDFQWLVLQSRKQSAPRSRSKTWSAKAALPEHPPQMAIMQSIQRPRKSRPPIPVEHYPYVVDAAPLPTRYPARSMDCPMLEIEPASDSGPNKKKRRRRSKVIEKERPPPRFWAPNPMWRGKCRGYAFGYPSYFATYENRFVD